MDTLSLTVVLGGFLGYSLISGRLQGTVLTAPLFFIAFGLLIGEGGISVANLDPGHSVIHTIAELTLILLLFTDAARIDLDCLRRYHNLPLRMLAIGLPLSIVAGTLVALLIFPQFSYWEAALIAAILAPTDAALGQSVVSTKIVPVRIRQAINVESGLNDGFALPAVLLFAALASTTANPNDSSHWLEFGLLQVTLGPLAGVLIGYTGARFIDRAAESQWMGTSFQGIGILALALVSFVCAEMIGGNGFIAAFVSGIVFGNVIRHPCTFLFEFMETEGQLLMLITFLVFGAVLLPEGLHHLNLSIFLYAILSLTVIRMLPIALSLLGTGIKLPTQLFLGWFGPRGLASILFVLLILEHTTLAHKGEILSITIVTVGLSALLHGITAAPFSNLYGRLAAQMGVCEENKHVEELPLRDGLAVSKSTRIKE